jgi:catechol 2,3-dioxygenase-like lactoylglutathione lyase family enzyme
MVIGALSRERAFAAERPKITGIDHASFYTTDPEKNDELYAKVLGLKKAKANEPGQIQRFMVGQQWVGYSPGPDASARDRMDHIAFKTDDAEALRLYMKGKGVEVPDAVSARSDGGRGFMVKDPEGHRVEFVEHSKTEVLGMNSGAVSRRMIHVGFIVRSRETEDRFYKDLLGFHIYWHGGMQPDKTDWMAMQVPDGTDWLEYMLNVPTHPDLKTTGVMNHISFGVADMKQAEAKLESHGWKAHGNEHAQMGKDGKWQLNLFDPDWSRVELMEFKPVEKPCCSDFQGPHPQEP